MTASPAPANATVDVQDHLDIAALYPADPNLMVSPEGDRRGLQQLKHHAQERIEQQPHS